MMLFAYFFSRKIPRPNNPETSLRVYIKSKQLTMNLSNVLFILVVFQLLFLSLFLFTHQHGKKISNRVLALFFLAICLNLLDVFLLQAGVYKHHPAFAGLGGCLPLLFGPLLYFYTRSIIYKNFSFSLKSLFHFLPFVFFFAGTEFYYLSQSTAMQENMLNSLSEHHLPVVVSVVSALIFLQFFFYATNSLRLVSAYKKVTGQVFSNPGSVDVSWLYSTIIFFILIVVISAANDLLAQTALAKYYLAAFNLVVFALFVFVIQVMMSALRQQGFFSFTEKEQFKAQLATAGWANLSSAEKSEREHTIQTALQLMHNEKPYLDPELTLDQLAAKMQVKPRALSQAINDVLQQNFFDFINRYRIEEAARLLTNPKDEKITVLEVLYQVGFNSKSSFNTLFKKYTGLTPTEFRKKQAN